MKIACEKCEKVGVISVDTVNWQLLENSNLGEKYYLCFECYMQFVDFLELGKRRPEE